jgi:hypothetical protein
MALVAGMGGHTIAADGYVIDLSKFKVASLFPPPEAPLLGILVSRFCLGGHPIRSGDQAVRHPAWGALGRPHQGAVALSPCRGVVPHSLGLTPTSCNQGPEPSWLFAAHHAELLHFLCGRLPRGKPNINDVPPGSCQPTPHPLSQVNAHGITTDFCGAESVIRFTLVKWDGTEAGRAPFPLALPP